MGAIVVSPVFIGRREELSSLAGQLERARASDPAFALIGGEAGVEVTRAKSGTQAGLASEIADGAAALRAHPAAIRLVGADILCSLVYGMQTVLLSMALSGGTVGR